MAAHSQDVERAFTDDTNRLIAERFPLAAITFVLVFSLAWVFEHRSYPERDRVYAILFSAEVLAAIVGWWLSRQRGWRAHVQPIAGVAAIIIMVLVGTYNVIVRSQTEVLTMALMYISIGTLVSFPWGWRGQLPVALSAVLVFVVAVSLGTQTATPLSMHVLGLSTIAALTVGAAGYLARHRLAVFRQAVELQAANTALGQANQALAEANQTKNEFLANVSHELRTPLNIILGYIDLLADGEFGTLPTDAADTIERIGRTCRTLVFLISDLLDLSRIEAGRLAVRIARIELVPVFEEMTRFMEPRLAKDVRFHTEVEDGIAVAADRDRLEQILVNLLSNATKFTERGRISLRAQPADDAMVIIEVTDTGIGIDPAELGTLFEPFSQGAAGKQVGGVGIGLSLSTRLAQAMGGQITATSQVGRGSTFALRLPASNR